MHSRNVKPTSDDSDVYKLAELISSHKNNFFTDLPTKAVRSYTLFEIRFVLSSKTFVRQTADLRLSEMRQTDLLCQFNV